MLRKSAWRECMARVHERIASIWTALRSLPERLSRQVEIQDWLSRWQNTRRPPEIIQVRAGTSSYQSLAQARDYDATKER